MDSPPSASHCCSPSAPSRWFRACLAPLVLLALSHWAPALEKPVNIGVYQGPVREGDLSANLANARSVIPRALERDCQFLVFPEAFLSGYESRAAVGTGARALEDPELQGFIRDTAGHDMVLVIGIARRQARQIFDSALVIHQGRMLGIQDKIHLTTDDRAALGFTAGSAVPVFRAHGLLFAITIGNDSTQLATGLAARQQGAELLLAPAYHEVAEPRADEHRRWLHRSHAGLASQLGVAIARADVVKNSRHGQVGMGGSCILGPTGDTLAEARLLRSEFITARLDPDQFHPSFPTINPQETPGWLRRQVAAQFAEFRTPVDDRDLRDWLENMIVHHRFTHDEVSRATGLAPAEVDDAIQRLGLLAQRPQPRAPGTPLHVLPYPGGRHPRLGFLEGAIAPQRETKLSVFTPWEDGGYVVVDAPEAVFSNLGLTYLAHTHIPTLWDQRGIGLPRLEWKRLESGAFETARTLPNDIAFRVLAEPGPDGIRLELSLRNGTTNQLTGLRVQNCVMLGRAAGFSTESLTNRVFAAPFSAARSEDGRHWVITAWEFCRQNWGNIAVPCIHSDPVLPDCAPGMTVSARGWVSFFEGTDITTEFTRLKSAGVLSAPQ